MTFFDGFCCFSLKGGISVIIMTASWCRVDGFIIGTYFKLFEESYFFFFYRMSGRTVRYNQ